ncbi:protein of unknown function [Shinella sp. WSC3-e]|nr:hypothetical protein SHINE37_44219 [Rhizobiaceae bacterium]CAK7258722.1 protein of unknown function [Shinella sp. WSC3-e]
MAGGLSPGRYLAAQAVIPSACRHLSHGAGVFSLFAFGAGRALKPFRLVGGGQPNAIGPDKKVSEFI